MNHKLKIELFQIFIILLPIIYLVVAWNSIPVEVPLRWNWQGESYDLMSKWNLWYIPFIFPIGSYLLLLLAPIDKKEEQKFKNLKSGLLLFLSLLAIFIIHMAKTGIQPSESLYLTLLGVLFTIIGYVFKFIKQNYFIGIRTPWTLKSEQVWNDTHSSISLFWVIAGIAIVIVSLIFSFETTAIIIAFFLFFLILVSIIFSYVWNSKLEKDKKTQNLNH